LRHIRFWTFSDDFFLNFVFPGLFGHNLGPLKKKNNENIFFGRLGKSTSIRAIDLAVQHINHFHLRNIPTFNNSEM